MTDQYCHLITWLYQNTDRNRFSVVIPTDVAVSGCNDEWLTVCSLDTAQTITIKIIGGTHRGWCEHDSSRYDITNDKNKTVISDDGNFKQLNKWLKANLPKQ